MYVEVEELGAFRGEEYFFGGFSILVGLGCGFGCDGGSLVFM